MDLVAGGTRISGRTSMQAGPLQAGRGCGSGVLSRVGRGRGSGSARRARHPSRYRATQSARSIVSDLSRNPARAAKGPRPDPRPAVSAGVGWESRSAPASRRPGAIADPGPTRVPPGLESWQEDPRPAHLSRPPSPPLRPPGTFLAPQLHWRRCPLPVRVEALNCVRSTTSVLNDASATPRLPTLRGSHQPRRALLHEVRLGRVW